MPAPANPAPVSGPGPLARRTDGGPGQPIRPITGLPYGDNQDLNTTQAAAPMAAAPGTPTGNGAPATPDVPLADMSPNLFDPTNYPQRPVTTGMPFGSGAGPEALSQGGVATGPLEKERLMAALPAMLRAAEYPDVSPDFRRIVALVRSSVLE